MQSDCTKWGLAVRLLFCHLCHDVFKLIPNVTRNCCCGNSGGRLGNDAHSHYWGSATPLEIDDASFTEAVQHRNGGGWDSRSFGARVLPKDCPTVIELS